MATVTAVARAHYAATKADVALRKRVPFTNRQSSRSAQDGISGNGVSEDPCEGQFKSTEQD